MDFYPKILHIKKCGWWGEQKSVLCGFMLLAIHTIKTTEFSSKIRTGKEVQILPSILDLLTPVYNID